MFASKYLRSLASVLAALTLCSTAGAAFDCANSTTGATVQCRHKTTNVLMIDYYKAQVATNRWQLVAHTYGSSARPISVTAFAFNSAGAELPACAIFPAKVANTVVDLTSTGGGTCNSNPASISVYGVYQ